MDDLADEVFKLQQQVAQLKKQLWHSWQTNEWWQGWWNKVGWWQELKIRMLSSGYPTHVLHICSPLTNVCEHALNHSIMATIARSMSPVAHVAEGLWMCRCRYHRRVSSPVLNLCHPLIMHLPPACGEPMLVLHLELWCLALV